MPTPTPTPPDGIRTKNNVPPPPANGGGDKKTPGNAFVWSLGVKPFLI